MLTQPSIERANFREAMSRVAAQVYLVTTDGPAGRRGVTVTSVASVSDAPAMLLACLNTSSAANARFDENGVFAVCPLGVADERVARAFAGQDKLDVDARFATGSWTTLRTGAPILSNASVAFDCRLVDSRIVATHRILIGEVVAVRLGEPSAALLYRDRRYLSV